jgi:hypothetical protein
VAIASPAAAGKWDGGCPAGRPKVYRNSKTGGTTSPFTHVGHDVTFQVKEKLALKGEGFSIEPDGNTVAITFKPMDGDPVTLPPFTVTAVSPMTLRFPMPDTRPILGRLVVGNAEFVIKDGERVVMATRKWPVVLPPMNDVRELTLEDGQAEIYGTLDYSGRRMWIPISFASFGEGTPMPACPTATLTPVTALAVDLTLRKRDGEFMPHLTYTDLSKTIMYFGDYDLFGLNLYGEKFAPLPKVRRLRNGGLAICALNDTFDLIFMVRLQRSARGRNSEIIPIQRDGSPYPMRLRNVSGGVASDLAELWVDSLGAICPAPLP